MMTLHRSRRPSIARRRRPPGVMVTLLFDRSIPMLIVTSALLADGLGAAQMPPTDRSPVEPFLEQTAGSIGRTESDVIAALGEPLARTVDQGLNPHEPGFALDLVTLHYSGLVVDLVNVPQYEKSMLSRIVMSDASWSDRLGVRIPATRAETLEAFGTHTQDNRRRLQYRTDRLTDPGPDSFEVVFEGDRVVAWIWSYWID